jgi:hypothetical protein
MERELTHGETAELLGAYALDAVEADEREAIEHHLQECPRCRAEVADHRMVASFMGSAGGPAPEGLWDRIAGSLDEAPPELRLAPVVPMSERRSVSVRLGAAVAAVAAAVIALLGVQVVRLNHKVEKVQTARPKDPDTALLAAAASALSDPSARQVALRSSDPGVGAQAVLLPDGTGYLLAGSLPALSPDQTYQLWAVAGGQKISAGVLGARPQVVAFRYASPQDLAALAVTAEQVPGVAQSANQPVVLGNVRTT